MKRWLWGFLAVMMIGGWAFFSPTVDPGDLRVEWKFSGAEELPFGILPYRPDEELKKDFAPLMDFLALHLNASVPMNIAVDYDSLVQLLEFGKVRVAWFSNGLFEQVGESKGFEALCRPVQNGRPVFKGAIVVLRDSGITDLAGLQGRRFAYVDRLSGSGFLYPARLFRKTGMDPVRSFSDIVFSGNHSRSLALLREGKVDGAAIFIDNPGGSSPGWASGSLLVGTPTEVLSPEIQERIGSDVRVIAWTDWLPTDPIVVRKDLPLEVKEKIRRLFLQMGSLERGPETLGSLQERRGYQRFLPETEIQEFLRSLRDRGG